MMRRRAIHQSPGQSVQCGPPKLAELCGLLPRSCGCSTQMVASPGVSIGAQICTPNDTVTAIRRITRAQALEQVLNDPTLAKVSLSSLAKRWGVSRSTARGLMKDGLPPDAPAPLSPVAAAMAAAPVVAAPPDGRLANFSSRGAGGGRGLFLGVGDDGDIPRRLWCRHSARGHHGGH
jgi:hypothetical protein